MTPPPGTLFLPPPPLAPPSNKGNQSSPRSRRPALERLSTGLPAGHLNLTSRGAQGETSSLSGRLQEVNIQYLGEEDQNLSRPTTTVHLGSCSDPIHPTLGHRLSQGEGEIIEEARPSALSRLEVAQPTVTVSIQAKPPRGKAAPKKKVATVIIPRGARSPLQGASTRKRNATRPKAAPVARKRLCPESLPCDKDTVPVSQAATPDVVLIPAAKKAKAKADFQNPPNPLP